MSGRVRAITIDRLILAGASLGLALSLGLHVAAVTSVSAAPAPAAPWSWALHGGAVVGFWCAAGRIAGAGLRGFDGLLRVRRMVPIPVRLVVGAATLNALLAGGLAVSRPELAARAFTAYWTMMYLLIAVLFAFVVLRLGAARRPPAGRTSDL